MLGHDVMTQHNDNLIQDEITRAICNNCDQGRESSKHMPNASPVCWICEASILYLRKANKQWKKRFDYSKEEENPNFFDLHLKCNICKTEFTTNPTMHLDNKYGGCKECDRRARAANFITKAQAVHEGNYIYDQDLNFKSQAKHVTIKCIKHGAFTQKGERHLNGHGCPKCGEEKSGGWTRTDFINQCERKNNGTAIFYIIVCAGNNELFFKIGITSNSVKSRFSGGQMPYHYDSLLELKGTAGAVYDLEKMMLRLNKANRYNPQAWFGGITECLYDLTLLSKETLGVNWTL